MTDGLSLNRSRERYIVRYATLKPEFKGLFNGPAWRHADTLELTHFRPEGNDHNPKTFAKTLYDESGIYVIFNVHDRFVRCIRTRYGEPVYKDSCVEFFVRPHSGSGYFNFEFNCGGAFLSSYIINPERTPEGFREFCPIPEDEAEGVIVYHSLPRKVEPEITEAVTWTLEFFIPFALLEKYAECIGNPSGRKWRANFYKCGDETSHPHWASWQPVPELNFHIPGSFGEIIFEELG
jgi:hypothetical protein